MSIHNDTESTVAITTPTCRVCGMTGVIAVSAATAGRLQFLGQEPVQRIAPDLSPELREQLRHGTHPECFPG